MLERTIDALARELEMDPVELRRKNFVKEFPHTMASGLTVDAGDYDASPRQAARASRPRIHSRRPGDATRERRREADRRRLLDLQRDVRARAVAHPRGDPLCGRRLGRSDDPLPAARIGASRDRNVAARSEPRDDLGADRRRPARRRRRRRRGAPRRHGGFPAGHGHVREPLARGRRHRAVPRRAEGDREGSERSSPTSSKSPRTTSSSRTARSP